MALGTHTPNYTLGRGEIYFARFVDDAYTPGGERYLGNTPEFNLTIEQETLDHFSSDRGIREKDDSIALQVNRTGSFTCDDIDLENVALFFFGSKSVVAEAGGATNETLEAVEQGLHYQLGISASRPAGARDILGADTDSNSSGEVLVYEHDSNSAGNTPFVEGTDYEIDAALGRIYITPGGSITDGMDIRVDYTIVAKSFDRVISGSTPVEGALRFVAVNPKGNNYDYYMPRVQLAPNGDMALKGDEWQTIPFNLEILKRSDREAIYVDGRPYTPS